jgi:glutathione peroxidase-family protein
MKIKKNQKKFLLQKDGQVMKNTMILFF